MSLVLRRFVFSTPFTPSRWTADHTVCRSSGCSCPALAGSRCSAELDAGEMAVGAGRLAHGAVVGVLEPAQPLWAHEIGAVAGLAVEIEHGLIVRPADSEEQRNVLYGFR
jgi:hypothetical protein